MIIFFIIKIILLNFKERTMVSTRRTSIFLLVFLLMSASFCFADMSLNYSESVNDIGGLSVVLNQILGFFRSNYMKAIISIALGGLAVGMIINRGEPGMVKKFIPWIAGCTLLLSLSAIVDIVFKTTAGK
jgi:hypothetical protein